jgi:hypothetical protein
MHEPENEFSPGQRIRLSALGKERCPRLSPTGVVIGQPARSDAVRVLMDGRKTPMTLHVSYIEAR